MLRALCFALLLAASPAIAGARLGETIAQCDVRYGQPDETGLNKSNGLAERHYLKGGMQIRAVFLAGRCVEILFAGVPDIESASALTGRNAMGGKWERANAKPTAGGHLLVSKRDGRVVAEAIVTYPKYEGDTALIAIFDPAYNKDRSRLEAAFAQARAAKRTSGF